MKTLKQIQDEKFTNVLRENRFPMLTMEEHRECTKEWLQQKQHRLAVDTYYGNRDYELIYGYIEDKLLGELE